ncbi:site-specific integrase [Bacillus sp. FJAT-49736]|uniref:tyrosine-type recombinase/integrase n=1 Tax=Bacillus sp. FJAT-49736 TaxID=2833582 RepID=UPI001BC93498|nr:site-specific integrase [Bacillus sp. FJAT-49736]
MASIQKRGPNSFLLVVEAGYIKGKRNKRTKTIRVEDPALLKTTKKLKDFLNEELLKFKMEVEAGEYIAPEKMKFGEFVKEWEVKYAKNELSPGTLDNYKLNLQNHILPVFEEKRLDQVKPIHVINFLNQIERKDGKNGDISVGTKQYIYRALRNVFQRAVDWKIIKSNPVAEVKKPRDNKDHEANVYSEKEVQQLFTLVQYELFHWRIFVTLALAAGLRRGELLGLEWPNIDLEKGTINIKQVIVKGENGRPLIKGPKSKKSKRFVSIPPSIVEELKKFYTYWKKEKLRSGDRRIEKEHEWVFCNEDGTHFFPSTPTTWWRRFIKRSEVRYIRLHDLRHTSATLLINQGVHAKIISERLGHADIRITMDTYGHALQTADKEAANKLDNFFSPQNKSI